MVCLFAATRGLFSDGLNELNGAVCAGMLVCAKIAAEVGVLLP